MKQLLNGIHRFQTRAFAPHKKLFAKLADKQAPEVLFITCSDSRVVPNLITQTKPGDLFVIRNAGNIVPEYDINNSAVIHGEAATIEFALTNFDIKDIVICGHSNCGAMKGLLAPEGALAKTPAVQSWLNQNAQEVKTIVRDCYGELAKSQQLDVAICENVLVQLEHLRSHPAIQAGLAAKRFNIHGWMYQLDSGDVLIYNPRTHQFISTTEQTELKQEKRRNNRGSKARRTRPHEARD